jgi:tRNA pseudouridine55 synthase
MGRPLHMPFLLIDKPAGITSHDVVDRVRRITVEKRVGHAGTLDPFATGLLIVGVGRDSTKHLSTFLHMDKVYEADIVLGATTETLDTESTVTDMSQKDGQPILLSKAEIEQAMESLKGEIKQTPPMHSAIKVGGKKLYELARKGQTIDVEPRTVTIHAFETLDALSESISLPATLKTRIFSSSGTYIRALARDLGIKLGTGGYLSALRRTAIGEYRVEKAVKLADLTPENWIDRSENDMLPSG